MTILGWFVALVLIGVVVNWFVGLGDVTREYRNEIARHRTP